MNITDIRVNPSKKENPVLKAVVSITIDDCFVIHDLKVLQGDNDLYIGMPSKKFIDATGKETHKDIAHPINTETREMLRDLIIKAYNKEMEKAE